MMDWEKSQNQEWRETKREGDRQTRRKGALSLAFQALLLTSHLALGKPFAATHPSPPWASVSSSETEALNKMFLNCFMET